MGPAQATIDPNYGPKNTTNREVLLKISGTSTKKRAKRPLYNDFPVPQNAWDKPGTRLGHATQWDTKYFSKNREKLMKIDGK